MSLESPLSASPANRITAAPRARTAKSTTPASTRRLSSFGPAAETAEGCAMAFTRATSAAPARKLRLEASSAGVERVAVIDMGSNSWRLVVFGYEPGTPWWSLVDEIREAVRIGAGMGESEEDDRPVLRPDRVELA